MIFFALALLALSITISGMQPNDQEVHRRPRRYSQQDNSLIEMSESHPQLCNCKNNAQTSDGYRAYGAVGSWSNAREQEGIGSEGNNAILQPPAQPRMAEENDHIRAFLAREECPVLCIGVCCILNSLLTLYCMPKESHPPRN